MGDRESVLRRTQAEWVNAHLWVPDSPRKVIVLVLSKNGRLNPMEARWSGGAWRFIHDRHPVPRAGRSVQVWMDIPWWDRYAQQAKAKTATAAPAGATSRKQSEAEAQTARRPHRTDAREEVGLSQAEAEFCDDGSGHEFVSQCLICGEPDPALFVMPPLPTDGSEGR